MKHAQFFEELSDDDLRAKADDIYQDLIDASIHCPNTGWHEACFAALHTACAEMQRRKMAPTSAMRNMQ